MALQKKRSNSARTIIIGLVVVVVAGVGYLLYQQLFIAPSTTTTNTTNGARSVISNFGESILSDPRFTTLKSYDVSVNADANTDGGQINPFH